MESINTDDIEELIKISRENSPELPPEKFLDLIRYVPVPDERNTWSGISDVNEGFRAKVSETLYLDFTSRDISLIRFIVEQDTLSRSSYAGGDIVLSSYMLFRLGEVEDVFRLFKAKSSGGMDTWIAMDPYLLFGAGIEQTRRYLQDVDDEESRKILRFLEEDFLPYYDPDLDRYRKGMEEYYAPLKK
ncbi:MAG: hypothetical protein H6658_15975 [Ardenticatenaceae bacterium]|nr:hypothetical protein [Ardenticatenaceae bacterium]